MSTADEYQWTNKAAARAKATHNIPQTLWHTPERGYFIQDRSAGRPGRGTARHIITTDGELYWTAYPDEWPPRPPRVEKGHTLGRGTLLVSGKAGKFNPLRKPKGNVHKKLPEFFASEVEKGNIIRRLAAEGVFLPPYITKRSMTRTELQAWEKHIKQAQGRSRRTQ